MTDPGWYADPHGQAAYRYWDGSQWTGQTSAAPGPQPPAAGSAPPPPPPQKKKRGTPTAVKVALGIVLGFGTLIVGCAVLIGIGANEVQKEEQEHAISRSEFESISNGTSQSEVEDQLGDPADAQDFAVRGLPDSSCIYYHEEDDDLAEGAFFQFCFDGGKLTSKNAY